MDINKGTIYHKEHYECYTNQIEPRTMSKMGGARRRRTKRKSNK